MKQKKPRELVDRPAAIKIIVGGVAVLLLGAFLGRVVWNERQLTAGIPIGPDFFDDVHTDPVSDEDIENHCLAAADNEVCRLSLPAIDAPNMKLVTLGTSARGGNTHIAAPKGIYEAGWFSGSARPGESGITFINAHSSLNNPATFNRLHELRPGDEITIERGDGQTFVYRVSESLRLSLDDANHWVKNNLGTSDSRRRQGGENLLYLMTCIGSWNLNLNTMNERILVRADLL
ncbi:class F sortase [Candidatus Saccharibacteria bacterium]|nr:class F sortase [Candidatus Saccharibacteria bacterium]